MSDDPEYLNQICLEHGLVCKPDINTTLVDIVLIRYISPTIVVLGTIGNVITVIILARLCRTIMPSCFYVIVGATADVLLIWTQCGNEWVKSVFGYDIKLNAMFQNESACKIIPFVSEFVSHFSSWMFTAVAIETGICYLRPGRLYKVCLFRRARTVVLLVMVLLICINAHTFWSYGLVIDERLNQKYVFCTTRLLGNSEVFWRYFIPVCNMLLTNIVPWIIVFSCIIVIFLNWSKFRFQKPEEQALVSSKLDCKSVYEIHLAVTLLCVSYLILSAPQIIVNILSYIAEENNLENSLPSSELQPTMRLAKVIVNTVMYAWLSGKFFIFIICVPVFKEHFVKGVKLICLCEPIRRMRRRSLTKASIKRQSLMRKASSYREPTHSQRITEIEIMDRQRLLPQVREIAITSV